MMKKLIVIAVIATLLASFTAGCGKAKETEETKSTAAPAGETTKIKVAHLPIPGQALYYIARAEGFFAEENLDVELIPIKKSAEVYNLLQAGKVDVGSAGTAAPLTFISKGAPFTIVGGLLGEGSAIVVPADSSIKEIKDLKDKKIATVRMATGDIVVKAQLIKDGLKPEDLEYVEFPSATDSLAALQSGKVDAAISWPPYSDAAIKTGEIKVLKWTGDMAPGHPCCRVVFNNDFVAKNPEAVVSFLKALIKAEKFFNENPEESLNIVADALKVDKDTIRATLVDEKTSLISADPNKKAVFEFYENMKKVGYLEPNAKDPAGNIDTSFYRKALNELVQANPDDAFYRKALENYQKNNE
ncbi:ABC transporter substrate-binding protein [Thermoanaerobacterium sp. DL9XJH110]|uniref:ABC transporter substrate-binding protein n=1 Tax=Thermoanaerobacterium sp. DL9XJH110 TaxID=3386643 RepID=UPI003BB55322